jgi:hypothetical protein
MPYRQSQYTGAAIETKMGVPEQFRLRAPGALAGAAIPQALRSHPASSKSLLPFFHRTGIPHIKAAELPEPRSGARAAIPRHGAPGASTDERPEPASALAACAVGLRPPSLVPTTSWQPPVACPLCQPIRGCPIQSHARATSRPLGRLNTPLRLRASRRTRLERTAPNPSSFSLSGFCSTLLSQIHKGTSPRLSNS